jgi:hypothetical protein
MYVRMSINYQKIGHWIEQINAERLRSDLMKPMNFF